MSKIAVFTMDVEDFTDIDCLKNYSFEKYYDVSDGIISYLDLLDKYNIKANLFVLNSYLDKIKNILIDAINNSHKISLHGYNHIPPMNLSNKDFEEGIIKSKKNFKEKLNIDNFGYRAPCFSMDNDKFEILKKHNILFDSSYLNFKNRYLHGEFSLKKFKKINNNIYKSDDIYEFLLPIYKNFPIGGGGYLRIAPWIFTKNRLINYLKNNDVYIFYLHPFEVSKTKLPKIKGLKSYDKMYLNFNRKIFIKRIEKIINILKKNGFEFKTFEELMK